MDDNNKNSEIEKLRLKLEKKLSEIEKRKKDKLKVTEITEANEEKTLFELREELINIQKEKDSLIIDNNKEVEKNVSTIANNDIKKEVPEKIEPKNINKANTKPQRISSENTDKVIKKPQSNIISSKSTNKVIKKPQSKIISSKSTGKIIKKPQSNIISSKSTDKVIKKTQPKITSLQNTEKVVDTPKTNKTTKSTIAKNKIVFIIAFIFALLYLGYLYKLKVDLNKEKEVLELKKQEQIDYSKDDAVFKEVEDDAKNEELQNIK